jgi:hypothetical protein
MTTPRRLPVRPHLRPKPCRDLLANVPLEVLANVPRFAAALSQVLVFGQVDRAPPRGLGIRRRRHMALEEAEAIGWEGRRHE